MHKKWFACVDVPVVCGVCRLGLLLILACSLPARALMACSSFMLQKDGIVIAGRNLGSEEHTSGVVVINKRGVHKEGQSWKELAYGWIVPNPRLSWVSKYASVTFNTFCRDFPDGGMNEAGLFVSEMSLMENKFPEDLSKPLLFMMLWMQYLLDNYDTVEQVIQSARDHIIDGWNWHFFAADRHGHAAAIEFIDGQPVIYYGENLPVTMLGNETYDHEMELLRNYQGFGGERPVILRTDTLSRHADKPAVDDRFVRAAYMINAAVASPKSPMAYGLDLLEELSWEGTQWSYVCDLTNRKVIFRTKPSPVVKELDLHAFDLSCKTPVKMIDIHTAETGTVEQVFQDYSLELNRVFLVRKIAGWETVFTSNGSTLEAGIRRLSTYSESTSCTAD